MESNSDRILPFTYSVNITLLGNAAGNQPLTLASDSNFELLHWVGSTDVDAAATVLPNNFTVSVKVAGSYDLMNNPVPQRVICAPANRVITELRSIVFPPNCQFQFSFLNLTGGTINVFFGMHGYRYLL